MPSSRYHFLRSASSSCSISCKNCAASALASARLFAGRVNLSTKDGERRLEDMSSGDAALGLMQLGYDL